MATLTRRIARCSTTFFRAASKAYMVAAFCGLVLMSAVAAHAEIMLNGMPFNGLESNGIGPNGIGPNGVTPNGMPRNGMPFNGTPWNGMPFNGCPMDELFLHGTAAHGANYSSESSPRVPNDNLPWATLSHQGLGKSSH